MGLLTDLLSYVDARKRVAASNLRDIANNPREAVSSLLSVPAEDKAKRASDLQLAKDRLRTGGGLLGQSVMPGVDKVTDMPEFEAAMNAPMGLLGAIKAYHGSPHKFDKFDMSKIGTGEGAQAYGHGLYFAESPGVAGSYKDKLAKNEVLLDGQKVKHNRDDVTPQSMGLNALQLEPDPITGAAALRKAAADDSLWGMDSPYQGLRKKYIEAADWLEKNAKRIQVDNGSLYEVSLRWPDAAREAADPLGPQHFLDWDKPLSQQPRAVKKYVESLGYSSQTLKNRFGSDSGKAIHDLAKYREDGQVDASGLLRNAGIPGIRYLDAGSRGAGQGTANYVAFDDALVEILKRNGLAP